MKSKVIQNVELKQLITVIKKSNKPVNEIVENYFNQVIWSVLKDEWLKMTKVQKQALYSKLEQERK